VEFLREKSKCENNRCPDPKGNGRSESRSADSSLSMAASEFVCAGTDVPPARSCLPAPTVKALRQLPSRTVLDWGVATARFLRYQSPQGFMVVGRDANESGLDWCGKRI
jgi:hypothetical protein